MFHAPSIQQETPFEFRIRYKFLSQSEAVVRYGGASELFDLGRVTPGTYCTRQFEECYRNKCRLQSPNYPGMYPRNVSFVVFGQQTYTHTHKLTNGLTDFGCISSLSSLR